MACALETHKDVVTEQQILAHLHHILRHAVVLGTDARARHHLHLGTAKLSQARLVQRGGLSLHLLALLGQALFDQLIGIACGNRLVGLCRAVLAVGIGCWVWMLGICHRRSSTYIFRHE